MHCPVCHKENPPGATHCEFCRIPLPDPSSQFQPTVPISGVSVGDQSFAVGGLIAGRYLVERELGRGGMGVVYLVKDQQLRGKEVAIKLISMELTLSPQAKDRFVQEVLAAQELQHPNIIRVFHLDEVGGQSFFTMEYVPGRSLRDIVEERKREGRTFTLKESEAVLMPVLKALNHAHTQTPPVIHRDIKPDNIVVTGDLSAPQVKVLDFGLAKMLSPSQLTTTAMTMGTAYYMAPEQVQGAKDIDQRADLFSVGVVLYETLTGRIPSGRFKLPTELNRELPAAVDDIIDTALQQEPADRYASAREMGSALESAVRSADEEAKRKEREAAEAELRRQREAEEEVKRQAEAEARRVAQEEARRKAEEEALQKVEEAKVKAAEEARQRAENEARMKAEAEARRLAEEEAKRKAEEEARLKTEAEALRREEVEAKRKASDEARRRQLEAERLEEEEFARRKAEEESRRRKMFLAAAGVVFAVLAFFVWKGLDKPSNPPQVAAPQSTSPAASPKTATQTKAPAAKQYSLTIRTDPADAEVDFLNKYMTYRPGIKLDPGTYAMRVTRKGYQPGKYDALIADRDLVADVRLEKDTSVSPASPPSEYSLTIRTDPADATVTFTDSDVQYRPGMKLASGTYEVEVSKDGYSSKRQQVRITDHDAITDVRLTPQYALTIRLTPADAQVKILNIKPRYQDGIKVEPGQYKIEVSKAGYKTFVGAVDVVDRNVVATVELEKESQASQIPVALPRSTPSNGGIWRDDVTGMEFVRVPSGCFQMGSNDGDTDERPVHEVCVDGFWLGRYEVTQGEWQKIMRTNPSYFNAGRMPVTQVSWNDVQEFIRNLNTKGIGRFRLPTEAEWEYAARSGGENETYAGGNNINRVAWYFGNSGGRTHPVGTKAPNGLGLYDMSGNVWEWCQDVYDSFSYSKHSLNNPIISDGSNHVLRGGSWSDPHEGVRSFIRNNYPSTYRVDVLGFRLLRTN